jgi:hypothetical protein
MSLSFREIANRITGFSIPIFGISWNPPSLDIDVARGLITFLEDRRILYYPTASEIPKYAVESVLQIRQRLTEVLEKLDHSSPLADSVRAMRAACRKFLDQIQDVKIERPIHAGLGMVDEMIFLSAIGELRGVFGIHIAQIAVRYGVNVEEGLSSILPAAPDRD